jgi:hypothetical protein
VTAGRMPIARPSRRAVALAQAAYLVPGALWPLLSRRSFEAVTGTKKEWWLVQNVALLAGAAGVALAVAGARRRVVPETVVTGAGSAAAFAAIDLVYLRRGRLRWTYGFDAAAEIALLAGWALARPEQGA